MKRIVAMALTCILVLLMVPFSAFGADLSQPIWELDTLVSLGAQVPTYNASTKQYEISTPEQLLYLSGYWKNGDSNGDGQPDAPCDGTYVLTADLDMGPLLQKTGAGYMPPIGASVKEDVPGGEKCAFFGTFDGQGHIISNLTVKKTDSKYTGLFGNIGYDFNEGFVRNLGLVNTKIIGYATCGLLAGTLNGDVENCYAQGTIDCEEKGAGGLIGKVKKNDNGYYSSVRNCFVYSDILIRGLGSENGAAGGVTSACSNGGQIFNCYAGGTITVLGENADAVGGISGNLKSGRATDNNVSVMKSLSTEGGKNVGLLIGSYAGETGAHIHNNYVWEGTRVKGTMPLDRPAEAAFAAVSASDLLKKSFFSDTVGWDMNKDWHWNGTEDNGYPTPAVFGDKVGNMLTAISGDLQQKESFLQADEPLAAAAYSGEAAQLTFRVLNGTAESVQLFYGTDKKGQKLPKTLNGTAGGDRIQVSFSEETPATYYYYVTAQVGGKELRFPESGVLSFSVKSAELRKTPSDIVLCPGTDYSKIGLNWTTELGGLTGSVKYWKEGDQTPHVQNDIVIETMTVGDNMGQFVSYSADLNELFADTLYNYQIITSDGTKEYTSDTYQFTTLPNGNSVKFAVISDLQADDEEGYDPYKYTSKMFLADQGLDFVINVGDLTENNTFAQWDGLFSGIGKILASTIHTYAPGNHEGKGDVLYTFFKGKTNLPGGMEDPYIGETTSSFVAGDCCFVGLNTEPYTGLAGANAQADKMDFYEKQMAYAKSRFEASGCRWRILYAHAGLIQDDDAATAYLEKMCNELGVDLYFNGHIHNYYRATCDAEGNHVEAGQGTTFVTTSPMGKKFDPYEGEIDDILDFQTGGKEDERQYVTIVEINGDQLTLTAYQRTKAGDSYSSQCKDYTAIDSLQLVKESKAPTQWILIGGLAAAAVIIAVAVIVCSGKRKKNA